MWAFFLVLVRGTSVQNLTTPVNSVHTCKRQEVSGILGLSSANIIMIITATITKSTSACAHTVCAVPLLEDPLVWLLTPVVAICPVSSTCEPHLGVFARARSHTAEVMRTWRPADGCNTAVLQRTSCSSSQLFLRSLGLPTRGALQSSLSPPPPLQQEYLDVTTFRELDEPSLYTRSSSLRLSLTTHFHPVPAA
jgi:hypothetical protein